MEKHTTERLELKIAGQGRVVEVAVVGPQLPLVAPAQLAEVAGTAGIITVVEVAVVDTALWGMEGVGQVAEMREPAEAERVAVLVELGC